MGWADRVGSFPVDEIDSVVLGECQDFSDLVLVRTPFSHRVHPPVTSRLLPLCIQMPRPGFQPSCIEDILKPWAIALMDRWFEAMLLTMRDMIGWHQLIVDGNFKRFGNAADEPPSRAIWSTQKGKA